MTDPTWLPSTIMQTIGALYGIFIAIFIIVMQSISKYKGNFKYYPSKRKSFQRQIKFFKSLFMLLAFVVIFVELYNCMIVYFISDSILDQFRILLFISFASFVVPIVYIIAFSYYMINSMISMENDEPVFYKNIYLESIAETDFIHGIIYIPIIFICVTGACYLYFKNLPTEQIHPLEKIIYFVFFGLWSKI
jgi:hypothetical protein